MRPAVAAVPVLPVLLALLTTTAAAGPITAGISLGATQDEVDAAGDASQALRLFGRLQIAQRLAAQLEVAKVTFDGDTGEFRTATALLVVDLRSAARSPLVPILLAGFGWDRQEGGWGTVDGQHVEGGVGLEYRAANGLVVGLDLRLGARQLNQYAVAFPATATSGDSPVTPRNDGTNLVASRAMQSGEYRAANVTVGIRF